MTDTATPTMEVAAQSVDARKTYGEGDAAVHAMHCVAGLDRLTSGYAYIGNT